MLEMKVPWDSYYRKITVGIEWRQAKRESASATSNKAGEVELPEPCGIQPIHHKLKMPDMELQNLEDSNCALI